MYPRDGTTAFGARLVIPRNKRERVLAPMKDELFDLEVDVSWAQTSAVDRFDVQLMHDPHEDPGVREEGHQHRCHGRVFGVLPRRRPVSQQALPHPVPHG